MSIPVVSSPVRDPALVRRAERALKAVLQWGAILVLALIPLPLGSVYPWAWSLVALACGALLILAVVSEIVDPSSHSARRVLRIPATMAALVVAWIVFQQLPESFPNWNAALWDRAARALGHPIMQSISVDRERSLGHLLRLLSYMGIFMVAWLVGRESERAARTLRIMLFVGTGYALYGLIVYFTGNRTVLWYPKLVYNYDVTGTFINRNSFATLMGLYLLVGLALMSQNLGRRVDGTSIRILLQSSLEAVFRHGVWTILSIAFIASALLLTHSRGGVVATIVGALALVLAIIGAPSLRGPSRWPLAALAGVGAMIMLALVGSGVLGRVSGSGGEAIGRTDIYHGTLAAIADHPVAGTGLGSFEYVFPPYQPQSELKLIEFAHNDYFQNVLELGIPVGLIFFAMIGLLLARCLIGVVVRRRNAIFPCLAVGVTTLVMVHSTIDFSMQLPAVSVTFAALLGIGVAQSVGSESRSSKASPG